MGLYDYYEQRLFPPILDRAMRKFGPQREETLAEAKGDVLEIGFGTGLNLRYYPDGVEKLSTVDPMNALQEKVQARIDAVDFPVERHHLPADGALPFDQGRFDTVTVTWTLCTIPDAHTALKEMHRVLNPEGKLLFIEHGRSDDAKIARWQDRINPIWNVIGCGCNLNRETGDMVERAGFQIERLEQLIEGPRVFATLYRGAALPKG
ncbi:MAG: class I SAM-dependent methyltransferase [Deltaproteobacteria bacterium]|nr:class I SAM-dependent methyltransferase [Deltaproteobacteria bacterium]MBW2394508.1 class I SAM-dependent methyltransferase [Deltaproteobacteria bacterium]